MARPSKLTKERHEKIVQAIGAGATYDAASHYAGIDYTTFRNWMKRGEQETRGKYFKFFNDIKKTEATLEIQLVAYWRKHCEKDWKACATFLERRWNSRWSKYQKVDLQHSGTLHIDTEAAKQRLIERLERLNEEGND